MCRRRIVWNFYKVTGLDNTALELMDSTGCVLMLKGMISLMLRSLIIISGGQAYYSGRQTYYGIPYCPSREEVSNG